MTIKSMRYGVSYKGSKNGIAKWVVDALPKAKHFYDLFAGGCAVTHAALLSGKYELFYANDIDVAPQLFLDAINGKYRNETRWISREDFVRLKDTDPYVRYCWSFGNTGRSYLYSKEIEPWKKALHYARVFKDFSLLHEIGIDTDDASRIWIKAHLKECKEKYIKWYCKTVLKNTDILNLAPNIVDHVDRLIGGSVINGLREEPVYRARYWEEEELFEELKAQLDADRETC